jgi:phosphoserine phosphatase RsbU/P
MLKDKDKSKKQLAQELTMLRQVVCELEKSRNDLRQMEARSKEAAQKYRIVADTAYDWEFWLSPDAQFIYSSPSCERITGYSADAFVEDTTLFYRILHLEDLPNVTDHMNRRTNGAGPVEIEFRINHRDGSERWIASAFQPVYDAESRYLGIRGSNRDITKRNQVEIGLGAGLNGRLVGERGSPIC